MSELATAVKDNDLDELRRLLNIEKTRFPLTSTGEVTLSLRQASIAAAEGDNADAMITIWDAGCDFGEGTTCSACIR